MKISFENKTRDCYKEIYHQLKYVQETCESVVPDISDDIGKIASVQSSVHLKGKDLTGRGVLISGEAVASVIYVTENEKNVSFVKLSKQFSFEYDIPGIEVTAMDVKGIMMANNNSYQLKAEYFSDAVREILQKKAYMGLKTSSVISRLDISATPDKTAIGGSSQQAKASDRTVEMVCESD